MPRGRSWTHDVLLAVLRDDVSPGLLSRAAPADWSELAPAATRHGLQGLLARCLRGSETVPRGFQVNLQAAAVRLMAQRENHVRTTAEAVAALATRDIVPVVLKGPSLAERYYPDPGTRPYGDVDLLVPPRDLRAAVDAFETAGFELGDRNWDLLVSDLRGQVHLLRPHLSPIELHWHVVNGTRQRRTLGVTTDAFQELAVPWAIAGRACRALAPEVEIPYLCLHAALHGASNALWLVDVGMIARRAAVDWDAVVRHLDQWKMRRSGLLVLDLVRRWVDPSIPALGAPRWSRRVLDRWDLASREESGALRKLLFATGGDDLRTTIRLLADAVVPPADAPTESAGSAARRLSWQTVSRISKKLRDPASTAPEYHPGRGEATIETYLREVEAATRRGAA